MAESLVVTASSSPESTDDSQSMETATSRILLLMEAGQNRRLLADWLSDEHDVTTGSSDEALDQEFDLCIVDEVNYRRHSNELSRRKAQQEPVLLPVLLLVTRSDSSQLDPAIWEEVEELIVAPIRKAELQARLANLLRHRETSADLAEREQALSEIVTELRLKERAMDAAPSGVTITDHTAADNPVSYANAAFERITGYCQEDVLGRNMRFLQGPGTDEAAVETLSTAVDNQESASVTLLNYRADGTQFWNRVDIAPVYDPSGEVVNYVGFQTDVTDEQIRKQRLTVMNRLMRHNLSNDLNVIQGFTNLLLDVVDDQDQHRALRRIQSAAADMACLGDDVSRIEQLLDRFQASSRTVNVGHTLARSCESFEEHHPEVQLTLDIEEGPWYVEGDCLEEVFVELLDNAGRYNEDDQPEISISAGPATDGTDRLTVRIEDNGPGIPEGIVDVMQEGEETQLKHGDGVGLWLVYWVVTLIGGGIEVEQLEDGGSAVTLRLPVTTDPEQSTG